MGHNVIYGDVGMQVCDCGKSLEICKCLDKPAMLQLSYTHKCCTYSASSERFFVQWWTECLDCGFSDGKGVCYVCAQKCHAGHKLGEPKFEEFFCDCGSEGCSSVVNSQ